MFWDDSITDILVEQTNLQITDRRIDTNRNEKEQFLGIHMLMSIINLPCSQLCWANETRYAPVADIISRNRFKKLRQYLRASDNTKKDEGENKTNKIYKVQPILDAVRNNCIKIEPE